MENLDIGELLKFESRTMKPLRTVETDLDVVQLEKPFNKHPGFGNGPLRSKQVEYYC